MDVSIKWFDRKHNTFSENFIDVTKLEYSIAATIPMIDIHCSLFNQPIQFSMHNILEIKVIDKNPTQFNFCKDGTSG